jgi:hypothetical protein
LVFAGIILSILLPLAVKALRKASGLERKSLEPPSMSSRIKDAWIRYGGNKYLVVLLAGTLIAIVIVYLLGMQFFTARDAILAGFAWESLLNKTFAKDPSS